MSADKLTEMKKAVMELDEELQVIKDKLNV